MLSVALGRLRSRGGHPPWLRWRFRDAVRSTSHPHAGRSAAEHGARFFWRDRHGGAAVRGKHFLSAHAWVQGGVDDRLDALLDGHYVALLNWLERDVVRQAVEQLTFNQ